MTTLRAIAEDAVARPSAGIRLSGLARYAGELTRALIAAAPPGCDVELLFAARRGNELADATAQFPGATRSTTAPLARRALATAWATGSRVGAPHGLIHAPSLLAPLARQGRNSAAKSAQVVVTVHDTIAWTHPASIGRAEADWTKRMARRAARFADAIVVPTHAVAADLADRIPLGERVRVIPGGISAALTLPDEPDVRSSWLGLPERFVLASGSMDPRTGIDALIRAAALPDFQSTPLLIVGDDAWRGRRITEAAMFAGLPEGRVRPLGTVSDSDLALLLSRAAAYVAPSLAEGFGLGALEALTFGTPLVHSDAPAHLEVAGGAGISVARADPGTTYAERLAAAVGSVLDGTADTAALTVLGRDRAKAFSWAASGAQVWQLHAEL
ncbi:glycosyltransferase family 4 protein [Gryllotalpicola reticulitermitis]|uniref:Glycosyltransferase family 4 protein n=1 Tax=Gryllotalpicola reticulitermitis TaxID=1184153 RepID=A0ABV8Q6S4_9MICO